MYRNISDQIYILLCYCWVHSRMGGESETDFSWLRAHEGNEWILYIELKFRVYFYPKEI